MRTRMVRVRRRGKPVKRMIVLFALTLAAYLFVSFRQGDPVAAVIGAKESGRARTQVVFGALELHAVRTAACDSEESARVEAARYIPRGAAGYIHKDETWHIFCAGYERETDARKVCGQLNETEKMNCDTISMISSAVTLNVTATKEQTEALIACDSALRTTVTLIGSLSYALDSGDASVSQAISVLTEQRDAMNGALRHFSAATGEVFDGVVCAPLVSLMLEASEGMDYLLKDCAELPAVLFSGRMKHLFLQLRIGQIDYLASLGG